TPALALCAALLMGALPGRAAAQAQQPYQLFPDWPSIPQGMFFGAQEGWPDQAARDAAAARRREAMAQMPSQQQQPAAQEPKRPEDNIYGRGVSGIAIDDQDNIYVFNRGEQTVLVFDREGRFVRGGAER